MYRLTYRGLTEAEKKAKFEAHIAVAKPQDRRGKKPYYEILDKDKEDVKEAKRKLIADWKAKARAEVEEEIRLADERMVVRGATLPKNKAVDLADDHPVCTIPINLRTGEVLGLSKAQSLEAAGVILLEHVEESFEGEPEKRKPGRPPKVSQEEGK